MHSLERRGWLVLIALFLVSLPAITSRIYASDEIEYFAYLRSVTFDGDLSFENEYRFFYDHGIARSAGFHETFLERTTATGLRINFAPIGCAILWAPFYAVADGVVRLMRMAGAGTAADGFSPLYVAAVSYGSAFYGFGAVVFSVLVARLVVGRGTRAALIVWLATPLLFYMYIAPPMSHAPSAFTVAAFIFAWLVVRDRWSTGGLVGLGALAGIMAMVREQDLFFVVGPALDFGRTVVRDLRAPGAAARARAWPRLAGAALGSVAFGVAVLPQIVTYLVLNGRLGPSDLVARKMTWSSPHAVEVLLSPDHGFLIWTPLAILSVVGLLLLAARRVPTARSGDAAWLAICALAMVALQVYVAGSVESWTVAGAFGQRRFVALTVLLTLGLAALWAALPRAGWQRRALVSAVVLCTWWNLGLMAQFGTGLMDRQRLEPARNAYTSFVVLPRRLPRLIARYLFDRGSFYARPAPVNGGEEPGRP